MTPDRPPSSRAGHRAPWVLGIVTIFIVYGSLYPFVFHPAAVAGNPFGALLNTWQDWDHRGDLLSNILLYMPFGFLATRAVAPRIPAILRVVLAILAGTALSACMETAQLYDADRVTSMGDVYANAIGSAIGASVATLFSAGTRWPLVHALNEHPDAAMLLAAFLGYRLYPYVPVIDRHKYIGAVRGLLEQPIPPPADLARFVVTWLFIAVVVESLYGFLRWTLLFPLLAGGVFLARIIIDGLTLTAADVAGAALAFVLWAAPLRGLPRRPVGLACLFAALIIALRLQPFSFSPVPLHAFGWVPFWSLMHGSIGVAIQAFLEKFYQYGGLIWLLRRAGLSLPAATGLTAGLLLGTSYAETYLPGRSGEMTDAAMALTIGMAFHWLDSVNTVDRHVIRAKKRLSSHP